MNAFGNKMKDAASKAAGQTAPRFAFRRVTLSETGTMASTREYEAIRTENGAYPDNYGP